jgi:hypothetical protein
MSPAHVARWVQDWGPLITLASAVLLTVATGILVWVTWKMAQGAKDAAEFSKTAAQASLASVAAIQASIPVELTMRVRYVASIENISEVFGDDEPTDPDIDLNDAIKQITGIGIRCDGGTVYIHGGRITRVIRDVTGVETLDQDGHLVPVEGRVSEAQTTRIELVSSFFLLPHQLHRDETILFDVNSFRPGEPVTGLNAIIDYSFDGGTIVQHRQTTWDYYGKDEETS